MPDKPPPPPPRSRRIDPLIGAVVDGRFQIVTALGAGATARVYQAIQRPLDRPVALKIIRCDLDPFQKREFGSRFLREASLAGRLSHPNVVTIYDFGYDDDGEGFIAMELLKGESLHQMLRREAPLDPERAAMLLLGVARGLRHAHAHGLVHRDIKPSNVLLVADDRGEEQPKLLDFGLVKETQSAVKSTGAGLVLGTPQYLAPEQAQGLDIDGRADLYALGCIFYRALTGVLPFEADNPLSIALMHVSQPYPPMSERAPEVEVDPALEEMVQRCMEKDPDDRWPNADALVTALEDWLAQGTSGATMALPILSLDEPASPPPPAPRRRWRAPAALLALLGLSAGGWALTRGEPPPAPATLPAEIAPAEIAPAEIAPGPLDAEEDGAAALGADGDDGTPGADGDDGTPGADGDDGTPGADGATVAPDDVGADPSPDRSAAPAPPSPPSGSASPAPPPPDDARGSEDVPDAAPPSSPDRPQAMIAVDEVLMTQAQAEAVLAFINEASEQELRAAGLYSRGIPNILQQRPYASIHGFAATPYVGEKSVQAALIAAGAR